MSIWDLRQAIESAIPAWVSVLAVVFAAVVVVYAFATRGRRR